MSPGRSKSGPAITIPISVLNLAARGRVCGRRMSPWQRACHDSFRRRSAAGRPGERRRPAADLETNNKPHKEQSHMRLQRFVTAGLGLVLALTLLGGTAHAAK